MRNLVLKNLTSSDRTKKIISSREILEKQGVRTIISRRFICKLIEIKEKLKQKPLPQFYVCRVTNHTQQQESFFYRTKASLYLKDKERLFLVLFGHSLKIDSRPAIPTYLKK
jgi:hypothetical protein